MSFIFVGGYPPKPHPRRCIAGNDEPEPTIPTTHLHACRGYGELLKNFFTISPNPVVAFPELECLGCSPFTCRDFCVGGALEGVRSRVTRTVNYIIKQLVCQGISCG